MSLDSTNRATETPQIHSTNRVTKPSQNLDTKHATGTTQIPIETHPLPPFLPPNAKLLMLGSFPPPANRWAMDFYYPNFQNDMWRIFGLVFFDDKDHFLLRDTQNVIPTARTADKTTPATIVKPAKTTSKTMPATTTKPAKTFDKPALENFLYSKGIALFDTATKVRRLKGNASDDFLEIVETIDLTSTLEKLPDCRAIMTAGEKATSTLLSIINRATPAFTANPSPIVGSVAPASVASTPPVGGFAEFEFHCGHGADRAGVVGTEGAEGGAGAESAYGQGAVRRIRHYRMPSSSRAYPKPLLEKAAVYRKMFADLGMV